MFRDQKAKITHFLDYPNVHASRTMFIIGMDFIYHTGMNEWKRERENADEKKNSTLEHCFAWMMWSDPIRFDPIQANPIHIILATTFQFHRMTIPYNLILWQKKRSHPIVHLCIHNTHTRSSTTYTTKHTSQHLDDTLYT